MQLDSSDWEGTLGEGLGPWLGIGEGADGVGSEA